MWLTFNSGIFNFLCWFVCLFFTVHQGSGVNMLEAWEPIVSAAVTLIHLGLDHIPTTTLIT